MKTGKWLLAVVVATGVLLTPYSEVTAAQGGSVQGIAAKKSEAKKLADLDTKIVEAAKKSLSQLAGEDVELIDSVSIYDTRIFIRTKEKEDNGYAVVDQKTGKVLFVSIYVSKDKADPKQVELAMKNLKEIDAGQTFEVEKVMKMLSYEDKAGEGASASIQGKNFNVMLSGDKVEFASVSYPKSEWNADIKKKAELEFKAAMGRTKEVASMTRYKDKGRDVWSVLGKNGQTSINIGVKTGKVWSVSDYQATGKTDKKALTEKNAVSYAAAFAKKVFNIDLKGYTAKKVPNFPVYEMTKKGAPMVEVDFNSDKIVTSMSIKPVNGIRN
ncbi:hypothetical protein [Paenibacillus agilis]|uniref:PepSY domain-containing protein n=1 Tax=Paenibacillus agilis TaxID=3020863 RepID=A0A559J2F6_9BACL|nr:hypothetical protein [Paenibacillus agilis]TVX94032.1 hypothetical protein FPZ44_13790 [Paenibacillus agilis]